MFHETTISSRARRVDHNGLLSDRFDHALCPCPAEKQQNCSALTFKSRDVARILNRFFDEIDARWKGTLNTMNRVQSYDIKWTGVGIEPTPSSASFKLRNARTTVEVLPHSRTPHLPRDALAARAHAPVILFTGRPRPWGAHPGATPPPTMNGGRRRMLCR